MAAFVPSDRHMPVPLLVMFLRSNLFAYTCRPNGRFIRTIVRLRKAANVTQSK